jgi:hypothetical protein
VGQDLDNRSPPMNFKEVLYEMEAEKELDNSLDGKNY